MRILHIIESLAKHKGGLPKALSLILKTEFYIGYTSSVLTIDNNEDSILDLSIPQGRIHSFKPSFPSRFHNSDPAIKWLANHVNEFDLVIIHSTWYLLGFRAALWLKKNSYKYVYWSHGSLETYDLKKKKYLKLLIGNIFFSKLLQSSQGVIFTSRQEKEESKDYGINIPFYILPFGFESDRLSVPTRSSFRRNYGFEKKSFIFLFLSRIHPKKQLELILHGIRHLTLDGFDVRLVIAGKGDVSGYEKRIQRLVIDLDIGRYVTFTGWLDQKEKMAALAGSDCFVLPSIIENFGIVVIESLLSGTPVLISDRVFIHNEIADLGAGWICKPTLEDTLKKMQVIVTNTKDYNDKKDATSGAILAYGLANVSLLYKEQYEMIVQDNKVFSN